MVCVTYLERRDTTERLGRINVTGATALGWLAILDPTIVREISDEDLARLVAGAPSAPTGGLFPSPQVYPWTGLYPTGGLFPSGQSYPWPGLYPTGSTFPAPPPVVTPGAFGAGPFGGGRFGG